MALGDSAKEASDSLKKRRNGERLVHLARRIDWRSHTFVCILLCNKF